MRTRTRLLLGLPLIIILLLAAIILALPGFVGSATHRATIEHLASSLTGRNVHIGGKLSLALFPAPQFIAERITIGAPSAANITARSLTLDIALPALLQGRLSASSLTLQSPTITIPWPLPAGSTIINQPGWLTALHAQIDNGRIIIGALAFTHVNADVFTSSGGAFSLSGNARLRGEPLNISLSLGRAGTTGLSPIAIDAQLTNPANLTAHLSGTLNTAGDLTATLSGMAKPPGSSHSISTYAAINATSETITASHLQVSQGNTSLTGTAQLNFVPLQLNAALSARNLSSAQVTLMLTLPNPPIHLSLNAINSTIAGAVIPQLQVLADLDNGKIVVHQLDINLPGNTKLTGNGTVDATGAVSGHASLLTTDLPGLLTAYGAGAGLTDNWKQAHLTAGLQGDKLHLAVNQLSGIIGPSHLSGSLIFTRPDGRTTGTGQLHFDQLDLTAMANLRAAPTIDPNVMLAGEITADRANIGTVNLTHVLLDAALDNQLSIRRLSASLYGGLIAASFNFSPGRSLAARALLTLPSAAPLFAVLPPNWQPPRLLTHGPLAISLLAQGPVSALDTSATATLGDVTITAAPVIDLNHLAAAGAVTLRDPNAIAAFAALGYNANLAWPGAGSISLRADLAWQPGQISLPDFVLSMGDLTANGTLAMAAHRITADIDAGTLAFPPLPHPFAIPWNLFAGNAGSINLTANRVWLGGQPLLGPSAASLILAPTALTLNIPHAAFANGNLAGSLNAALSPASPPTLTAKFNLSGADAAVLNLPFNFPITLPSGTFAAHASLTASGYSPPVWAATLAGPASLAATAGTLSGFSLPAMAASLAATNQIKALRAAILNGTTPYATLTTTGNFVHGSYNLTNATLQGLGGTATATGSIDLPDTALALKFLFTPSISPPINLGLSTIGTWSAPKQIPNTSAATTWKPSS